jgi:hypothetical protein
MTRRDKRVRQDLWAFAYAGLCVVIATVAFISVTALAPGDAADAAGPTGTPTPRVSVATAGPSATVSSTPAGPPADLVPSETPVPKPTKGTLTVDLYVQNSFVSQITREYCMAGAIQNMVNIMGPTIDLTTAKQQSIGSLLVSLTTPQDSYDGGFGPNGWALTMNKLGYGPYKLVIDSTFSQAMRDAAIALASTMKPVGLLTWWGAHSWVMTGFKADADPALFPTTFVLKGAYIVDPFYPRVSSIWGQTLGPDSYRDMTAMAHNYIGWKRPEGSYPTRDGKWLLVIPYNDPAAASPSVPTSSPTGA